MINKFFLTFMVMMSSNFVEAVIQKSSFGHLLADEQDKLSTEIKEIIKITNIQPVPETLSDLKKITQQEWLRRPGTERWEIDPKKNQELQEKLKPVLSKLQLIDEVSITENAPDYIFVMGGIAKTLKLRLQYAQKLVASMRNMPQIYVLVGQREVSDEEKKFLKDFDNSENLKTEVDIARFLINQTDLFPEFSRLKNIHIVDTPASNVQGKIQRPTTDDTVKEWLKLNIKPGTICAISSVPFVQYQDAALRSLLPKEFSLTTVGPVDDRTKSVGLYLDTLARWIYAENNHRELKKNN